YQEEIREIIDGKIETLIEKTQNLKKVLEIEINKLIKQPTFEDTIWLAPYIMKEFKIDFTKQFSIYNLFFSIVRRMAMDYRANFYYTKSKKDILKINLKINPKLLPYLEYSLWYCLINNVDISDYNAALQASSIIIQKKMRRKKKK
ncbi:MAG: hypothetical protein KKF52_00185, partial [Nanoarchaeota archaeon]|nr:hypothetical protein [Nanoarchaeota archaeon]